MGYKLKRITIRPNGVEKQVRPTTSPWWQPWANTIAYWELNWNGEDTKNDYWVTTYTTTDYDSVGYYWAWLPTYTIWRKWKQCASFDWTRTLKLPTLPIPSNTITISARVNYSAASTSANWPSIFQLKQDLAWWTSIERNSWSVYFGIKNWNTLDPFFVYGTWTNGTWAYNFTWTVLSTGEWHNVIFTFNAWTAKYYVDWVLKDSHTVSGHYLRSQWSTPSNIGGTVDIDWTSQRVVGLTWLIQDVIYENTVWDDQYIADYYTNY